MKSSNLHYQCNTCSSGCKPAYVSECFDYSDKFVCPASDCHNDGRSFACRDGKYCIFQDLICDGYPQCEDWSGNSHSMGRSVIFSQKIKVILSDLDLLD